MRSVLFVSPSVGVGKLIELLNEGFNIHFYQLKYDLPTTQNREHIKGTCHRVLNIDGQPYCVDSIKKLPFDKGVEVITNREREMKIFDNNVSIKEFPIASEWLFDVWANV